MPHQIGHCRCIVPHISASGGDDPVTSAGECHPHQCRPQQHPQRGEHHHNTTLQHHDIMYLLTVRTVLLLRTVLAVGRRTNERRLRRTRQNNRFKDKTASSGLGTKVGHYRIVKNVGVGQRCQKKRKR